MSDSSFNAHRADKQSEVAFNEALAALHSTTLSFGIRFLKSAEVRQNYTMAAEAMVRELEIEAKAGAISYEQAARQAYEMRDRLLRIARDADYDISRAIAERAKLKSPSFAELVEAKSLKMFQKAAGSLNPRERGQVMREVLRGAGRTNAGFTAFARKLEPLGKGFFWLSVGISAHAVITAESPAVEAVKEGAVLGSGLAGSIAGGAAAGLVCGPGAPVCSTIGVVVGGVLFAFAAQGAMSEFSQSTSAGESGLAPAKRLGLMP